MLILVLNSGSSSIKLSLFDAEGGTPAALFEGEISGIGKPEAKFSLRDAEGNELAAPPDPSGSEKLERAKPRIASISDAIKFIARAITGPEIPHIDAIGYRIVHPGPLIHGHQLITDALLRDLGKASDFAPLHDPAVLELINTMRGQFPAIQHYACFDTVFHDTLPPEAFTYPIPAEYAAKGARRYGFHGLSCESIVLQLHESGLAFPQRLAIAHLGSGASITACVDGRSVDTSMGLTPTGGIVMATRPGDLDPGLVLYLLRQKHGDIDAVDALLNHSSGLEALAGTTDMRDLRNAASHGNEQARFALRIFTRSVTKVLGSYLALLGGLDAIVFAGGIGEHDAQSRSEILTGMASLGMVLDPKRNGASKPGIVRISTDASPTAIFTVPAQEGRMIARHVLRLATSPHKTVAPVQELP